MLNCGQQLQQIRGTKSNLPLLLADSRVDCNAGEVTFAKQLVKFSGSNGALDKDNDLVELKAVEKVIELSVLLAFAETDRVLLETVQSKLGFIVHKDFKRISHKFSADWSDILGKCGAEHHDLFLGWGRSEDLLNVTAHICPCG